MQFSVGILFRLLSLAGLAAGWLLMLRRTRPETTFLVLMCAGTALSWIVGIRSLGGFWHRARATVGFILATLVVALHSSLLTAWLHPPHQERVVPMLLMMTPLALFAMVFLLRSWTWAAHDWRIRLRR